MTIQQFIKQRPHLIWWVKNYNTIDESTIVEATLNYGDWDDVLELIKILGIKKTAEIFRKKSKPDKFGRCNYFSEIKNYFRLFFNKYA